MEHFLGLSFQPAEALMELCSRAGTVIHPRVLPLENLLKSSLSFDFIVNEASVHAKRFPLTNPIHVTMVIIAYLISVWMGKRLMAKSKPFNMFYFALVHNFAMVVLSFYMGTEILYQAWMAGYSFVGNPLDNSETGWPVCGTILLVLLV
jgi:hypothetical protein